MTEEARLAKLEEKTRLAEELAANLEQRMLALERQRGFGESGSVGGVSEGVRVQVLEALYQVRDLLKKTSGADAGDVKKLKAELKALEKENQELKEVIAKRDYRIKHLLRSLDAAENASK